MFFNKENLVTQYHNQATELLNWIQVLFKHLIFKHQEMKKHLF